MVVGVLRVMILVPESRSLKEKRAVMRSLKGRIESRFRVAVGEVGGLDDRQEGELGIACVSTTARHADEVLAHVADFAVENAGDGVITQMDTEIVHLG